MTDRETLELAAKAAGELTPSWYGNEAYFDGLLTRWNPLTDDGDAFRLAVNLGLWIHIGKYHTAIETTPIEESANGDPYAATRRAIVRAAAEIGRSRE